MGVREGGCACGGRTGLVLIEAEETQGRGIKRVHLRTPADGGRRAASEYPEVLETLYTGSPAGWGGELARKWEREVCWMRWGMRPARTKSGKYPLFRDKVEGNDPSAAYLLGEEARELLV